MRRDNRSRSGGYGLLDQPGIDAPSALEDVHEDGTRSRTLDAESRLTVSATERPPDLLIGSRLSIVGWLRGPPTPTLPGSERIGEHLALAGIVAAVVTLALLWADRHGLI
jgi:hypothetical protein